MSDEYQNAVGMTAAQIAETLRAKYHELLPPHDFPEWKDVESNLRARWSAAVEVLFEKCERGVTVDARKATEGFVDAIRGAGTFTKLRRPQQLLWEAMLRYCIMLIMVGRGTEDRLNQKEIQDEFREAKEYNWNEWLVKRMKEAKLVPKEKVA